jgi:GTP-binding protein
MEIRNIGIVAHVDHGKTTLVDSILKQSGIFRENETVTERVMDNLDQEKERGITIEAKNASFFYKDSKVNLVDTPGHADFGGEVERILGMVDAVCLLVDASEGPLPQTRFVLSKAMAKGLKVLVIINKIDRKDARIREVENEIFDLFISLGANDDQMEYKTLYAIARQGMAFHEPPPEGTDLTTVEGSLVPLFETILKEVPASKKDESAPLALLISNIAYSDYLGRMAVGRIEQGKIKVGENVIVGFAQGKSKTVRVQSLLQFEGMKQKTVENAVAGDIVIVTGIPEFTIGDTITVPDKPHILPRIEVDPPTVSMSFYVNTSPLAGREGKVLLSREFKDRLDKEALRNVAIRVQETDNANCFLVFGRGELQLAVIIEKIRREGFELAVGKPQAVMKEENGQTMEPMEEVMIDAPENYIGKITEMLHSRKGQMQTMTKRDDGRMRLEFLIPSRGLIGFRTQFLTETRGTGILNTLFAGYAPHKGEIQGRINGSLVSDRTGETVTYGLFHLEPRGRLFVGSNMDCYEGMVIGEHNKDTDLFVNPTKEKKLSNMRAAGKDELIQLSPQENMSLEKSLEWIRNDEIVEITPKTVRIRKANLKKPN